MTTFQKSSFREVLDGKAPIPVGQLAYFRERQRNRLYDFIVSKFLEKEDAGQLSRADLARRIDKDPAQISKWLASPTNWTLDTISDLTLAIFAGELIFNVAQIADVKPRNSSQNDILKVSPSSPSSSPSNVFAINEQSHAILRAS